MAHAADAIHEVPLSGSVRSSEIVPAQEIDAGRNQLVHCPTESPSLLFFPYRIRETDLLARQFEVTILRVAVEELAGVKVTASGKPD